MLLNYVLAALVQVAAADHWVSIWGAMAQQVEPANLPEPPFNSSEAMFRNATLRQTVYTTQDASVIRLQLSNVFGGADLPVTAATVALPLNGSAGASAIEPASLQHVTFSGRPSLTIPDGATGFSDPLNFSVAAGQVVTVTLYLASGQASTAISGHPGSRTTSWMAGGNRVAEDNIADVPTSAHTPHWYFLSGIDAWLPSSHRALVIVGDSISDGRGSTTNGNDRWPDQLLARMQQQKSCADIALVNEAAGGNRVLADGVGPNALGRIDRDVVAQAGVAYALVFEGVNDLGTAAGDAEAQDRVVESLLTAYDQVVLRLHRFGIPVFGATLTPFGGPGQAYGDSPVREEARRRANRWIREAGRFDAVVDFDAAVRDPRNASRLDPRFDSGDHLHLNPAGYGAMAGAVDLGVFDRFSGGVQGMV